MEETEAKMKVNASVDIEISHKLSQQLHLTATKPTAPLLGGHDDIIITDSYLDSFPVGYRFCPIDEELIMYYLKRKIMNEPLPPNKINDVNLYQFNPHDLAVMYKGFKEREQNDFYFFTPRDRKYLNGTRPNRAAGDGYWKATGADKSIKFEGNLVGFKKTLVFHKGKPPKGDKTNWIMQEYRVNSDVMTPSSKKRLSTAMRLDDWVLCRIYYKERVGKSSKAYNKKEVRVSSEETIEPNNRNNNGGANFTEYGDSNMQYFMYHPQPYYQQKAFRYDQFQHDVTSMAMVCASEYSTNDIFADMITYQDSILFESQLDFTNHFEDNFKVNLSHLTIDSQIDLMDDH